ncbi:hypothetical protein Tco_0643352 [Tanacetum coccineum]
MGDENPIRTLRDFSKSSHEGYRNNIKFPVGNNTVPLRSDTIWLVQNRCSLHGLRFEDPNQHLKDFLKLVNSLDLDVGSITTWEDLTTRFLAQFFLLGRTAKLRNDILMFQQLQIFYDRANPVTRRTIDQSTGGKLRDRNAKDSWALLEDLALYDNKSWNDPRDFAKPIKAITLPQDVPSTSDRRLIKLENQVQRLMEAHLAPTQPTQVNKITTSCEICSGPHDTQYCMEDPEQAFVEYASSRTDEAGEGLISNFMASQDARLSKFEANFKQQQNEMTNKIDTVLKAITDQLAGSLPCDTVKNLKLSTSLVLFARSYQTIDPQCSTYPSTSINSIKTCSREANISQTSQLQTGMGIGTQKPEETKPTLEDEFQNLHFYLPVLEVLAHALIYNAMLDKYVESLELGKTDQHSSKAKYLPRWKTPGYSLYPVD